jgi:hypothetical protein
LPPGNYRLSVLANGFATLVNPSLTLTIGQRLQYNPSLRVTTRAETVTVPGGIELVDTTRTTSSTAILASQIINLPINERNYINFTLLTSVAKRDDTPSFGAAPTSGFDFNGQSGRSNELLLDGADATDASVDGFRSTVSQEAVQEFQVLQNSYMPEFGRAAGGVVNIVTKSGFDQMHGNIFGFLRDNAIQARDPFAVQVDGGTGEVTPGNQAYTRVQTGASLGGHLGEKMFYFLGLEMHHREEASFSSVGQGATGLFGLTPSFVPCLPTLVYLTQQQATYFQKAIPAAGNCLSQTAAPVIQTAELYGAASNTAMYGKAGNLAPLPYMFPMPVGCNMFVTNSCTSANTVNLPTSFVPLTSLIGNFPAKEKTFLMSFRLDRIWSQRSHTLIQFALNPSTVTGIQVETPGEVLGENAGSRTSAQHSSDLTGIFQHTTTFSPTLLNELRFQYAHRGLHFGSVVPGGSDVGVNILGTAYFGQQPFSTLDRKENRWEGSDNFTWARGSHTMKLGFDFNLLQLSSAKSQLFQLNYGGVYDFSALTAGSIGLNSSLPGFTAVQAYGLGIPQDFTQGFGQSKRPFDSKIVGVFVQDSWALTRRLTLNYGVRYDLNLMPVFAPATGLNQFAEPALNVVEGIPSDYKEVGPRIGLAWDPRGNGTTVVRASYGIYYDQIPLAIIYDSTAANAFGSAQMEFLGGLPSTAFPSGLNAASVFQGVVGAIPQSGTCGSTPGANLGFECAQQRFNSTLSGSTFTNYNFIASGIPIPVLPFTLPIAANFVTAYAEQSSLSLEHEFARNYTLTVSYAFIHGVHLDRSRDINQPSAALLTQNYANAIATGMTPMPASPLLVQVPTVSPGSCLPEQGGNYLLIIASGELARRSNSAGCAPGSLTSFIATPAVFNFFRPSGPNPSYGGPNVSGYQQLIALANMAGYPTGFGVPVPWSSVYQQESSGMSAFSGLTVSVNKRFSSNFQFQSSWTWSHAIDNSTDLSFLLDPQDNQFPDLERGNSDFDERYRWVTSGVLQSPYRWSDKGWRKKLLASSFVAPIIEISSGRPYNVLTGADFNLNFNNYTGRPSVVAPGTAGSVTSPFLSNVAFTAPNVCSGIPASVTAPSGQVVPIAAAGLGCDGSLGRNAFTMPAYFNIDFRYDRKFHLYKRFTSEFIADAFNVLNRFNVLAVNVLCNPLGGSGACQAGQPSAEFNPRQFQFGMKINW